MHIRAAFSAALLSCVAAPSCGTNQWMLSRSVHIVETGRKHITVLEPHERGDQVGRAGKRRARCDLHAAAHLIGDDVGEGGLAETRGAVQEDVLHGVAAAFAGLNGDAQTLDQVGLPDVLAQIGGAERPVDLLLLGRAGSRGDEAFRRHGRECIGNLFGRA